MNIKKILLACIVVLLPVSAFFFLGLLQLRLEEPRRGLVALEMFFSKEFIVPKINGWAYYNKPPVFNWSIALCYWLFSSFGEWVVRLPSIIAYLLTGLGIYRFTRSLFDKETGILAALFFLTFSDLYFFGTEISGEIDLFFTMIIFLQLAAQILFFRRQQYLLLFVVSYFLTGVAFLTKGMPSILFQGITLLIICLYYKKWKLLFSWKHFVGLGVCAAIIGGYFYAYTSRGGNTPGYLAKLFYDATEKSGLEASMMDNVINFLETPLHLLRFLSPWILFLLFVPGIKKVKAPDWINVLLLIVGINIIPYLFTAHSKANYMYPLNPFIAILLAWFYTQLKGYAIKVNHILEKIFFGLMLIVVAAIIAAPFIKEIKVALPGAWVYSLCLAVSVGTVAFYYHRLKAYRIYLFILFWILLKLAVTAFYNPALQYGSPEQHYKEYVQKAINRAGPHHIYLWGDSSIEKAKVALGPIKIDTVQYVAPTYILFTVPFYYSSLTHTVMQFSPFMKKDSVYMYVTDKKLVSNKVQVLDVTQPNSENKDLFYLISPLEDVPYEPKNARGYVKFE